MRLTNQQKILHALEEHGPQCDDCLSETAQVAPRQTVNRICHALLREQRIQRRGTGLCPRCQRPKITNRLQDTTDKGADAVHATRPPSARPRNQDVVALSEDEIKKILVRRLEAEGWSVAVAWGNTPGIDIDARRNGARWIMEVKGPGSRPPMRVNYFLTMLGETLQRMDDPHARYSIVLPELPQYRRLWQRLPALAKTRTGIDALFVDTQGRISMAK